MSATMVYAAYATEYLLCKNFFNTARTFYNSQDNNI